jgi:DEAD/DEAH box helicase domain-containing protein
LAESGSFDGDKKTLHRLRAISKITSATCDGDSSDAQRARIKTEKTQIVLTNPDSLHHRILPGYPKKWTPSFWHNLEFLVLDEAHVLRGVGGSHVGNVLRRVLRVCRECGNENLKFIATSATIGNPGEHVFKLTTVDPVVITESGAPSGPKGTSPHFSNLPDCLTIQY